MNTEPILPQAGLGATLRALRQARQVELGEVSARLKFSVRQLQALEDEDWATLPSGLPLRGMVKNYGRFLETDTAALLVMLDAQTGAVSAQPAHVETPASLADADASSYARHGGKPWVWMLLILVVLIAVCTYAVERGWVPESWLVFDWLRASNA